MACKVFFGYYNQAMDKPTTLRIPEGLQARLKALVAASPPSVSDRGPATVSVVMREAMLREVEQMEREAKQRRKGK